SSRYSQSLTSSVTAYPVEHGRRYHAYKDGSYIMPNDENEADRLDLLHHMLMILFDGKRIHSPVKRENLKRILDAGTGTGIWAIDVDTMVNTVQVIGNDLSPTQPQWVPPNVKFEVDDIEEPWTHAEPFDLIFSRYMDAAITNWPALVANMYTHTKPGGWVELQGFDTHYKSDDGSFPADAYINKFVATLEEGCTKLGKEVYTGPTFAGLLKDAGFVNVHVQKYKLPLGPWPKDKKMKEIGTVNLMQVLEGMEAFSYRLFTGTLGWSLEEVQVLIAKTVKELKTMKFHAYNEL
ncbi:hypothetical protein BK809_0006399, partial [Diplodia seriata]